MGDFSGKFLVMSVDSDGIDGPTDASGAWIDDGTFGEAKKLGLDPIFHLKENDSYNFFEKTGNLIKLGETSTNVSDIRIFIAVK
jgi:glycerate-2-kinase